MNTRFLRPRALSLTLLTLVAALAPLTAHAEGPIERYALIAGSNDGGPSRVRLRYANSDAEAMAKVLTNLGGVDPANLVLLREADRSTFLQALQTIEGKLQRARARGARPELVVYYSGHSDEDGLLLSGQRLGWSELRQALKDQPADVRIAILDSCASGAMLRAKGGQKRAPFLMDASSQVTGHAYLTSSSADEAAQESDGIGASFFTHNLVTGLRGAADTSGDRRVTLAEAYQFAFQKTLARTESTQRGAQHPNYDFDLAGSGDIVVTELTPVSSVLIFDKALVGKLFVRDGGGRLVAELDKVAGLPIELGLEAGPWKIGLSTAGRSYQTTVTLARGQKVVVNAALFTEIPTSATRARGDGQPADAEAVLGFGDDVSPTASREVDFSLSFVPGLGTVPDSQDVHVSKLALGVIGDLHHSVHGIDAAGVFTIERAGIRGVQAAGVFNMNEGGVEGVQAAGTFNYAQELVHGVQSSGAVNVARSGVRGVQGAAATNVAIGPIHGVQAAGAVNLAIDGVHGVQAAGAVNIAHGDSRGLQLAGACNITDELAGAQIGTVNIASKVKGLQLGVVNIADEVDGEAIGLLSIIGNGYKHIEVWSGDTAAFNVGAKLGGRHVYTLFTGGVMSAGDLERWNLGVGLGGHLDIGPIYLDMDVTGSSPHTGWDWERANHMLLSQARLAVGLPLGRHLALFAGASYNASFSFKGAPAPFPSIMPEARERQLNDDVSMRMWPGFFAGVRL
jgi:hypothetical protein